MSDGHDAPGAAAAPPPGREPAPPRHAPGRRLLRRAVLYAIALVVLCLVAAIPAAFVSVPYYAVTPGSGVDVESLIGVPKGLAHAHLGSVLLTDVELVPLRALSYLYYKLDPEVDVVPTAEVLGGASGSQYERQGEIDMANARQAAVVVALDELGYKVRAVPNGVIVYQPERGSPAARGLAVGDVIDSLDGRPVRTLLGLESALGGHRPGAVVRLGLRGMFSTVQRSVQLRLGELRVKGTGPGATEVCAAPGSDTLLPPFEENGAPAPCLGIVGAEQSYSTRGLPFEVSLSSDGIVGPSAGLAFALGLIEKLDRSDLTAGLKVAATGTISVDGQVGPVGGVAQKAVAVSRAGASVFFVPSGQLGQARRHAGPHLTVLAVSTIGQAIADLEQLGGRIAPPSVDHGGPRLTTRA